MKMKVQHRALFCLAIAALAISCDQHKNTIVFDENAPEQSMKNATIQQTEEGKLQMTMWGEEIWNYNDSLQTQEFPKRVKATFYDENGKPTTVITADEATNWQAKKLMQLRKNVVIQDFRDGTTSYTEEFFWDQERAEVYGNLPIVQKNSNGSYMEGTGFRADEQMERWNITKPRARAKLDN